MLRCGRAEYARMSILMQRLGDPSTEASCIPNSTACSPTRVRAGVAANAAVRSGVALARISSTSGCASELTRIISRMSSSAAAWIASSVLLSAVVAPRIPRRPPAAPTAAEAETATPPAAVDDAWWTRTARLMMMMMNDMMNEMRLTAASAAARRHRNLPRPEASCAGG